MILNIDKVVEVEENQMLEDLLGINYTIKQNIIDEINFMIRKEEDMEVDINQDQAMFTIDKELEYV